jgi:hypothetical protein
VSYQTTPSESEIEISAPEGTYQPPARALVFTVQSVRSGLTTVLLDGAALPLRTATGAPPGWWHSGTAVSIQIDDDGRAHKLEIR